MKEVRALEDLGKAFYLRGEEHESIRSYQQALEVITKAKAGQPGPKDLEDAEVRILSRLGRGCLRTGADAHAAAFLSRARSLARTNGDAKAEAAALGPLGEAYERLGSRKKSLKALRTQLNVLKQMQKGEEEKESNGEEGRVLSRIASVYRDIGDDELAMSFSEKALMSLQRYRGPLTLPPSIPTDDAGSDEHKSPPPSIAAVSNKPRMSSFRRSLESRSSLSEADASNGFGSDDDIPDNLSELSDFRMSEFSELSEMTMEEAAHRAKMLRADEDEVSFSSFRKSSMDLFDDEVSEAEVVVSSLLTMGDVQFRGDDSASATIFLRDAYTSFEKVWRACEEEAKASYAPTQDPREYAKPDRDLLKTRENFGFVCRSLEHALLDQGRFLEALLVVEDYRAKCMGISGHESKNQRSQSQVMLQLRAYCEYNSSSVVYFSSAGPNLYHVYAIRPGDDPAVNHGMQIDVVLLNLDGEAEEEPRILGAGLLGGRKDRTKLQAQSVAGQDPTDIVAPVESKEEPKKRHRSKRSLNWHPSNHSMTSLPSLRQLIVEDDVSDEDDSPSMYDLSELRQLYGALILPIEQYVGDLERMVIVPHVSMSLVPFSALQREDGRFLIECFTVSQARSISTLLDLAGRQTARHHRYRAAGSGMNILIGDLDHSTFMVENSPKPLSSPDGTEGLSLDSIVRVRGLGAVAASPFEESASPFGLGFGRVLSAENLDGFLEVGLTRGGLRDDLSVDPRSCIKLRLRRPQLLQVGSPIGRLANGTTEFKAVSAVLATPAIREHKSGVRAVDAYRVISQACGIVHLAVPCILDANEPQRSGIAFEGYTHDEAVLSFPARRSRALAIEQLLKNVELLTVSRCDTGGELGKVPAYVYLVSALLNMGAHGVAVSLWPLTAQGSKLWTMMYSKLMVPASVKDMNAVDSFAECVREWIQSARTAREELCQKLGLSQAATPEDLASSLEAYVQRMSEEARKAEQQALSNLHRLAQRFEPLHWAPFPLHAMLPLPISIQSDVMEEQYSYDPGIGCYRMVERTSVPAGKPPRSRRGSMHRMTSIQMTKEDLFAGLPINNLAVKVLEKEGLSKEQAQDLLETCDNSLVEAIRRIRYARNRRRLGLGLGIGVGIGVGLGIGLWVLGAHTGQGRRISGQGAAALRSVVPSVQEFIRFSAQAACGGQLD
uniref:CHAT domain-containing protein n=1 Tax=Pinguiococcus pyrenoidosus TaxID=172671 RepID=A0A6U0UCV2_9STRA